MARLIDASKFDLKGAEITWLEQRDYVITVHREELYKIPTVDAIPIEPLAVWLAGYHVSPPEYALKETGALDPIDPASTVFTPNQIATAWAYHLRKLMESGLMDG